MDNARVRIIISGGVQGVFFRTSAQTHAAELGLGGLAENLPDGTVRIVAEGPKERILEFIEWCKQGPPFARVRDVAVHWEQPEETFKNFSIT